MTTTQAPLARFKIIGYEYRVFRAIPEAPAQPAGTCFHCGQGIAHCVLVQNLDTREIDTVGTTCAERVGLDAAELKAYLADRFAEEREFNRAENRRARMAAAEARDLAEELVHGPHGTETRYGSGCTCDSCLGAAPHGTWPRFEGWKGSKPCRCGTCLDYALVERADRYQTRERTVIVDLETGLVVKAKTVETRYGYRWCVRDGRDWLPVRPARRSTLAKKGYVEAEATYLVEECKGRRGTWFEPVARLSSPIVDNWGERIERPS